MPQKPNKDEYTIEEFVSSDKGVRFEVFSNSVLYPEIQEDSRCFDYTIYAKEIHAPVELALIDTCGLERQWPRCLDMPIRLSGQKEYSLPEEWQDLAPLLKQIIEIEHGHNPNWQDYHTYMTIDCSAVKASAQQRHGGLHVDGFQGERIFPKTKITRNYVVSSNGGTRFFPQRFVVADPAKFNVFHGFDMQTPGWESNNWHTAKENVVYFMDAYSVHESGFASQDGLRVFLRLTWDLKVFDRLGNTRNSMLRYDWNMIERTTQGSVQSPDINDLENSPFYPVSMPRKELDRMVLIGLSGKPGSGKNWVSLALLRELRFLGVNAAKTSVAKEVYQQANLMIEACQSGYSFETWKKEFNLRDSLTEALFETWQGDVGQPHPKYGYHRRNEKVRRGLELLTAIRRNEDETYWLKLMLEDARRQGVECAVFSDLRFPNEAQYIKNQNGFCIRVELNEIWLKATQGRNPGYKYSQEYLNSPLESALDSYKDFFAVVDAQNFDAEKWANHIVEGLA